MLTIGLMKWATSATLGSILYPEEREEFQVGALGHMSSFCGLVFPNGPPKRPGIDEDIAKDADTYSMHLRDGTVISPPYHCFAAFLGEHLETLVCSGAGRQTVIELSGREKVLFEVRRVIEVLTPTIRSFNNREKGLRPWDDFLRKTMFETFLYVMLRPLLPDITKEEAGTAINDWQP